MAIKYSWQRLTAIITKEFIQMLRDRGTLGMIIALPLMQIILFGYAINTNPKNLPTAVIAADHSVFTRDLIQGMENTGYFHIIQGIKTEAQAEKMLATNKALFVLNIPPDFTRNLIR